MKGLILVYLATVGGTLASFRYPLIGLQVYVGLAILRPQFIFGFAGDLSNLSFMVGVAVLIGWVFKGFGSWRFGRAWPVVGAFLAFVFWFLLSSTFALDPSVAFESSEGLSKLALPFLVGVTLMDGEKDWRPMLWTIVLTQGYVGLEQNINYLFKGYNTAGDGFGGMDNNCFGVSLVTVLGPAVALMISSKSWYWRALAGLSAALILHTTMLTFSRGAMLGLIAVAITAFVIMPKRPKYIGALVLTGLISLQFVGPQLYARYSSTFASEEERDTSSESRLDLWKDCLKVVQQYPAFGVGPANWRIVATNYGWPEGKSAHSVWIETAAEVGIPGTLLLMMFFGTATVRLWPIARARQTDENRYEIVLASGVILAIVGFSVSGMFVSVPGLEVPYYVTMLGAAMLKQSKRVAEATVPAAETRSFPAASALRPEPW